MTKISIKYFATLLKSHFEGYSTMREFPSPDDIPLIHRHRNQDEQGSNALWIIMAVGSFVLVIPLFIIYLITMIYINL